MDNSLWEKIGEGDKAAYGQLYTYYYKRLYNYGKKFTNDDTLIEDTVQEIFLHFWKERHKIAEIENPPSYFFYSFRNKLFQHLKQKKKKEQTAAGKAYEPTFNIESIIISKELEGEKVKALQQAIQNLPTRQREIIFLRFYECLSYEQIATMMEITVNSTYKMMTKALHQLRSSVQFPIGSILLLLFSQG